MRFILIAALLAAGPAMADLVAASGQNELRLSALKCENAAVLDTIKPEWHEKFKAAQAVIGGRVIRACWIDTGEKAYFVVYENGETAAYPEGAFSDQGT